MIEEERYIERQFRSLIGSLDGAQLRPKIPGEDAWSKKEKKKGSHLDCQNPFSKKVVGSVKETNNIIQIKQPIIDNRKTLQMHIIKF